VLGAGFGMTFGVLKVTDTFLLFGVQTIEMIIMRFIGSFFT
jgi:hypothetical protein